MSYAPKKSDSGSGSGILPPETTSGSKAQPGAVASILFSGIDMAVDPLDATNLSERVWTKNETTGYCGRR